MEVFSAPLPPSASSGSLRTRLRQRTWMGTKSARPMLSAQHALSSASVSLNVATMSRATATTMSPTCTTCRVPAFIGTTQLTIRITIVPASTIATTNWRSHHGRW
jgi:hypothetical protein